MIVLVLKDGDCRVDPHAGEHVIPKMHTSSNGPPAMWDVCNQCDADVNVRLWNATPTNLSAIFPNANPAIPASGNWDATVDEGVSRVVFRGGANPTPGNRTYHIAVKFKTEGEGGWSGADPELQIDYSAQDDPGTDYDQWIIVALLAAAAVVGAGWWLANRPATR
jgi:hypothetical protein